MRFSPSLICISALIFSGCGNPLGSSPKSTAETTFHPGAPPEAAAPAEPTEPLAFTNFLLGFKVTPGVLVAAGHDTAVAATVNHEQKKLAGAQVSGKFSVNTFFSR